MLALARVARSGSFVGTDSAIRHPGCRSGQLSAVSKASQRLRMEDVMANATAAPKIDEAKLNAFINHVVREKARYVETK
jgi:hypothetical protein